MLHAIFQRHHIRPGEFFSLPSWEQEFLKQSMMVQFEAEERRRKEAENKKQENSNSKMAPMPPRR